jgi:hypothetical protein
MELAASCTVFIILELFLFLDADDEKVFDEDISGCLPMC